MRQRQIRSISMAAMSAVLLVSAACRASDGAIVEIWTLSGHTDGVGSVAFSPDRQTLASGSFGGIKLWDVSYPYPPRTLAIDGPSLIAEGTSASLDVSFADPGRDVMEVWFSVIEGPSLDLLWAPYVGEFAGVAEGTLSLGINPKGRGLYRVQVTLVDAAGLESEPVEFAFEVYTPTPPGIRPVTFPTSIPANTNQESSFQSEDSEGDIVEARFEIAEGDPATIEIDPGLSFDPKIGGETDGAIGFTIRVMQPQTVTLRSILVDAAGLQSEPSEFTFTVE